jgi:hypothetical protein
MLEAGNFRVGIPAVAARALRVTLRSIRTYIDQGRLKARAQGERVRKFWLVSVESLEALREARDASEHGEGAFRPRTQNILEVRCRKLAEDLKRERQRVKQPEQDRREVQQEVERLTAELEESWQEVQRPHAELEQSRGFFRRRRSGE